MITYIKCRYKTMLTSFLALLTCCNTKPSSTTLTLSNATDSVSYYTGIFTAGTVKDFEETNFNTEVFHKAVSEVLNEEKPQITKADADYNIGRLFSQLQKKLDQKTLQEGRLFLEENKKNEAITTTPTGLQYQTLKPGHGNKPAKHDKVIIKYKASLIDGYEFINSIESNQPDTFQLDSTHVIPGWYEGIQLMDKGSIYKFYLPSELAYGKNPIPIPVIKPNMALIYEIELVDIIRSQNSKLRVGSWKTDFNKMIE